MTNRPCPDCPLVVRPGEATWRSVPLAVGARIRVREGNRGGVSAESYPIIDIDRERQTVVVAAPINGNPTRKVHVPFERVVLPVEPVGKAAP